MNVYERRAKETAMLFEQPSTTSEIAEAFGISVELAMADLRVFNKRGILKKAGMLHRDSDIDCRGLFNASCQP